VSRKKSDQTASKKRAGKAQERPESQARKSGGWRRKSFSETPAEEGKQRPGKHVWESIETSKKGRRSGERPPRRDRQPEQTWIGKVSAHADGFGFVDVEGLEKGLFLPHEEMRSVMHGDTVEVRRVFRRGREAAEVVRLIQQAPSVLAGQFTIQSGVGLVQPRSRKMPQTILVSRGDAKNAHDGDWVRIEIQRGSSPLRGRVVEVLGDVLSPTRLIDLIVAELELASEFPAQVLAEANRFADMIDEKEIEGRKDLRHLPFVTIDGEDARDFDDAICVLPRGDGFEAWVAIADVAHYVRPRSALDQEALERSNSFYFPDRVIPMLPEKLSNGLCSLNPHVPRLAMTVRMRYDANGNRRSIRAYDSVILSQARLTYTQVGAWLDKGDKDAVRDDAIRGMLDDAARLYRKLADKRAKRGALDLDIPEVRALLETDCVLDIKASERNTAHRLIEEMMLAANTAIAEYMEKRECPLLYRIHPAPERESVERVNEFLAPFGLFINLPKRGDTETGIRPADVERVLEKSEGKPFAHVLHRLVLRAMQQARYTPANEGHFGLAFTSYTHFTSPIRRYADLTVHRRLKALLAGKNPDSVQPAKELAAIGEQTSTQERKQQRGEWDTQAMLAALFHTRDIGKVMPARISGLTKNRIFFELEPTLAEGSMSVDELPGSYTLDDAGHCLASRRSGHAYHLGDQMEIIIDATDPVRGTIHVTLAATRQE